jgi:hypothetical protein
MLDVPIVWYVMENTWLSRDYSDFGWGNGYVAVQKGHPWYGVHYDYLNIYIHGGLTYSDWCDGDHFPPYVDKGWWVVGFDTSHHGDSLKRWPKHEVERETKRLYLRALEVYQFPEKELVYIKGRIEEEEILHKKYQDDDETNY